MSTVSISAEVSSLKEELVEKSAKVGYFDDYSITSD